MRLAHLLQGARLFYRIERQGLPRTFQVYAKKKLIYYQAPTYTSKSTLEAPAGTADTIARLEARGA